MEHRGITASLFVIIYFFPVFITGVSWPVFTSSFIFVLFFAIHRLSMSVQRAESCYLTTTVGLGSSRLGRKAADGDSYEKF